MDLWLQGETVARRKDGSFKAAGSVSPLLWPSYQGDCKKMFRNAYF